MIGKKWLVVEIDNKGNVRRVTSSNTIRGAHESIEIHRAIARELKLDVTYEIRSK